ncbi:hypothetical protein JVX93_16040 [Mycolicibacterium boenickei]|nr:hypothetical protein JVX93_16040 [Mycolicibacterium boenickei]
MSCEWQVDRTCLPDLPVLGDNPSEAEQAAYDTAVAQRSSAENIAIQVLWALSGRQLGVCETTVRPRPAHSQGFGYCGPFILTLDMGHWVNWPCGCIGSCSVSTPRVVHLPGPVDVITAVTIDGVQLDQADYQLEGNALYRKGGQWPRQDLGRPLGEAGTWSVTYTLGIPVPAGVDKLTGQLAREFLNAACGDEDECRLPRTLVSTTRRGVTNVFDPSKILAAGKTGLTEVDLWLAAINPHALQQNAEVL